MVWAMSELVRPRASPGSGRTGPGCPLPILRTAFLRFENIVLAGARNAVKARPATEDSVLSAAGAEGRFDATFGPFASAALRRRLSAGRRRSAERPLSASFRRSSSPIGQRPARPFTAGAAFDDVCRAPAPTGPSSSVTGAGPASASTGAGPDFCAAQASTRILAPEFGRRRGRAGRGRRRGRFPPPETDGPGATSSPQNSARRLPPRARRSREEARLPPGTAGLGWPP